MQKLYNKIHLNDVLALIFIFYILRTLVLLPLINILFKKETDFIKKKKIIAIFVALTLFIVSYSI